MWGEFEKCGVIYEMCISCNRIQTVRYAALTGSEMVLTDHSRRGGSGLEEF